MYNGKATSHYLVSLPKEAQEELKQCEYCWGQIREHGKMFIVSLQALLLIMDLHPVQVKIKVVNFYQHLESKVGADTLMTFVGDY